MNQIIKYKTKDCLNLIKGLLKLPKYTKLKVSKRAWIKLMCYINLVGDYEIGGFGRIKNGEIIDFKILRQVIGRSTTYGNEKSVVEFMQSVPMNEISEWELDWHSHVDFEAAPSCTDWSNYALMQELRMGNQFPVMVVNKRQEFTLINYINYIKKPCIDLIIEDIDVTEDELTKIYNKCKLDVEEMCLMEINTPIPITGTLGRNVNLYHNEISYCANCGWELITPKELEIGLCCNCM